MGKLDSLNNCNISTLHLIIGLLQVHILYIRIQLINWSVYVDTVFLVQAVQTRVSLPAHSEHPFVLAVATQHLPQPICIYFHLLLSVHFYGAVILRFCHKLIYFLHHSAPSLLIVLHLIGGFIRFVGLWVLHIYLFQLHPLVQTNIQSWRFDEEFGVWDCGGYGEYAVSFRLVHMPDEFGGQVSLQNQHLYILAIFFLYFLDQLHLLRVSFQPHHIIVTSRVRLYNSDGQIVESIIDAEGGDRVGPQAGNVPIQIGIECSSAQHVYSGPDHHHKLVPYLIIGSFFLHELAIQIS